MARRAAGATEVRRKPSGSDQGRAVAYAKGCRALWPSSLDRYESINTAPFLAGVDAETWVLARPDGG